MMDNQLVDLLRTLLLILGGVGCFFVGYVIGRQQKDDEGERSDQL